MIALHHGVSMAVLRSSTRVRAVVNVRRLAVLCLHSLLGTPLNLIAANLSISPQAAHQLQNSATAAHHEEAQRLANVMRAAAET